MISQAELQREVAEWTYKPGYRLTLEAGPGGPVLVVAARVEDTYRPGRMIDLRFTAALPPPFYDPRSYDGDLEEFRQWLRDTVGRYELHERDEWLLRAGVRVFDPHADRVPYTPAANLGRIRR